MCEQADLFNLDTESKLAAESIEQREQIIRHYCRDPRVVFFCSHSGGADSQAQLLKMLEIVPRNQIVVLHACLGERLEHTGVMEHIRATVPDDIPVHVVTREDHDLFDTILKRGMWPDSKNRFCTSHHKTALLDAKVREIMDERGAKIAFSCMGLRADESRQRAMKNPLFINKRLTGKGTKRVVYDWLPIFDYSNQDRFNAIYAAGQTAHPIYGRYGEINSRLSCQFCVLAKKQDLANAAKWYPENYHYMVAMERVMDHSVFVKKRTKNKKVVAVIPVSIAEKAEVPVDEVAVQRLIPQVTETFNRLQAEKAQQKKAAAEKKAQNASKKVPPKPKQRDPNTQDMFAA